MDDVIVDEAQPAARACASCGASLRPDARFCASCGNWIGAVVPVEEPANPSPPVEEQPPEEEQPEEEPPEEQAADPQPAAEQVVEAQPDDDHPGTFEAWREMEELRAVEGVGEPDELDELELPDEIEEITELHSMTPPPRPGVQPVSLSREPMSRPRRVLVAIALLMLFGAVAVALRTVG
jgi:hypothetical protein